MMNKIKKKWMKNSKNTNNIEINIKKKNKYQAS
jgi:hypothetical protein